MVSLLWRKPITNGCKCSVWTTDSKRCVPSTHPYPWVRHTSYRRKVYLHTSTCLLATTKGVLLAAKLVTVSPLVLLLFVPYSEKGCSISFGTHCSTSRLRDTRQTADQKHECTDASGLLQQFTAPSVFTAMSWNTSALDPSLDFHSSFQMSWPIELWYPAIQFSTQTCSTVYPPISSSLGDNSLTTTEIPHWGSAHNWGNGIICLEFLTIHITMQPVNSAKV